MTLTEYLQYFSDSLLSNKACVWLHKSYTAEFPSGQKAGGMPAESSHVQSSSAVLNLPPSTHSPAREAPEEKRRKRKVQRGEQSTKTYRRDFVFTSFVLISSSSSPHFVLHGCKLSFLLFFFFFFLNFWKLFPRTVLLQHCQREGQSENAQLDCFWTQQSESERLSVSGLWLLPLSTRQTSAYLFSLCKKKPHPLIASHRLITLPDCLTHCWTGCVYVL